MLGFSADLILVVALPVGTAGFFYKAASFWGLAIECRLDMMSICIFSLSFLSLRPDYLLVEALFYYNLLV